jgi:hypothetical protein
MALLEISTCDAFRTARENANRALRATREVPNLSDQTFPCRTFKTSPTTLLALSFVEVRVMWIRGFVFADDLGRIVGTVDLWPHDIMGASTNVTRAPPKRWRVIKHRRLAGPTSASNIQFMPDAKPTV